MGNVELVQPVNPAFTPTLDSGCMEKLCEVDS